MGTHPGDGEWLELVADLMGRPLTAWPTEQILPLLAGTFGAPAGSFNDRGPSGPIRQETWPADLYGARFPEIERWGREHAPREHPLLRYYLASGRRDVMQVCDVPEGFTGRRAQDRWRSVCHHLLGDDVVAQVSLPVCSGPLTNRAFLVGRVEPFSPAEMAMAGRLQRVFTGLDRQIAAHARWTARTGEHAVATAAQVGLTPRESAVLDLLATGGTARAIARRLVVGERTVQKHLQRVYAKLGVPDRLAAVQRAQVLGLLPSPDLRTP
jgi:DNA-binding CsgD family transcriptional regulator